MSSAMDKLRGYVNNPYFDESKFEELLNSTAFTPTQQTYETAIGSQFQDLLNRQATQQDIDYYTNYLKEFNIKNPGQMSSSIAERLAMTPEFKRKGPLTASEEEIAAYYGRPIRTESGEKTGKFTSRVPEIKYKYADMFA